MSIKDIKKALSRTFQGVLKNIVSLANDSTLESDLKPLKVGQKSTPLQISESELKPEPLCFRKKLLGFTLPITGVIVGE